jgi:hypothetical protein
MGMRNFGINFDWRVPKEKCINALTIYFPFKYTRNLYYVDIRLHEWESKPETEDFNNLARGINLEGKNKGKINLNSIFTVTGRVVQVVNNFIDNEEEEVELGSFEEYFLKDGIISIPRRVKEIIDRRDPGDDDEPSKEKPTPPHVYRPSKRDFVTNLPAHI